MRVQLAQILGAEPLQVLAQMNHAHAIHLIGMFLFGLDAIIKGNDGSAGLQPLGGHCFQEGQAHSLFRRRRTGIDVQNRECRILF